MIWNGNCAFRYKGVGLGPIVSTSRFEWCETGYFYIDFVPCNINKLLLKRLVCVCVYLPLLFLGMEVRHER